MKGHPSALFMFIHENCVVSQLTCIVFFVYDDVFLLKNITRYHSLNKFAKMRSHLVIPILFLVLINTLNFVESGPNHGRKLIKHLLKDYEPHERPVASESDAVQVKYGLSILKTYGVCPKSRALKSNVWQSMSWKDVNLKWNPSDYGNIKDIRLPSKSIWIPDIIPYNTEDYEAADPYHLKTDVIVYHDGSCTWIPPLHLRTHCEPSQDANAQTCEIKLGSWSFNGLKMDITLDKPEADLEYYTPGEKWVLKSAPAKREEIFYSCCPEPYVRITYQLNFEKPGLWDKLFGFEAINSTSFL